MRRLTGRSPIQTFVVYVNQIVSKRVDPSGTLGMNWQNKLLPPKALEKRIHDSSPKLRTGEVALETSVHSESVPVELATTQQRAKGIRSSEGARQNLLLQTA